MNKKMRMTLDDIIRAKLQKDKDKLMVKEVIVPSIGKSLLFKRPTDEMIMNFIDGSQKDGTTQDTMERVAELLYMCCEELQNPELLEAMEVTNPPEVVLRFMDASDIFEVGSEVCEMNRLYSSYTDDVKN